MTADLQGVITAQILDFWYTESAERIKIVVVWLLHLQLVMMAWCVGCLTHLIGVLHCHNHASVVIVVSYIIHVWHGTYGAERQEQIETKTTNAYTLCGWVTSNWGIIGEELFKAFQPHTLTWRRFPDISHNLCHLGLIYEGDSQKHNDNNRCTLGHSFAFVYSLLSLGSRFLASDSMASLWGHPARPLLSSLGFVFKQIRHDSLRFL